MLLCVSPAGVRASDFAELGHPAFVRSLGLPIKQRRAIRCVERWTKAGEREKVAPLVGEIVRRTAISVGYPAIVERSLRFERVAPVVYDTSWMEDSASGPEPEPDTESQAAPEPELPPPPQMPAECSLLAQVYAEGGLPAAAALLGPPPVGPVTLPSVGTCLAYFKSLPGPDDRFGDILFKRIRKAPPEKLPVTEREAILRDLAAFAPGSTFQFGDPPRALPFDENGLGDIVCFGATTELAMRLQGPDDPPIDMIDDHVRLFAFDAERLDELDADLAAHPEWRDNPQYRQALGLIEAPVGN